MFIYIYILQNLSGNFSCDFRILLRHHSRRYGVLVVRAAGGGPFLDVFEADAAAVWRGR